MGVIKDLWWLIKKRGKGVIKIKGDIFPDRVVYAGKWRDKFFVVCEHSIWEIDENHLGLFFKLISTKGLMSIQNPSNTLQ